jgi:hypothetical protein
MLATNQSAGLILAMVMLTASVRAADAPTPTPVGSMKILEYFDNDTLPAGPRPDGAIFTFVDSADPSVSLLSRYGSKVIEDVGAMLVNETTKELATKETRQAVAELHLKGMELPKQVIGRPKVTAVKRTSLMLRNPENAPDGADMAALKRIRAQLIAGDAPDKVLVQKIEIPGKPLEWRVYRPIATSKSCLACHGDPAKFSPGVKEALDHLYPEDKAVDYSAQDWRGVIRVTLEPLPEQK